MFSNAFQKALRVINTSKNKTNKVRGGRKGTTRRGTSLISNCPPP